MKITKILMIMAFIGLVLVFWIGGNAIFTFRGTEIYECEGILVGPFCFGEERLALIVDSF